MTVDRDKCFTKKTLVYFVVKMTVQLKNNKQLEILVQVQCFVGLVCQLLLLSDGVGIDFC